MLAWGAASSAVVLLYLLATLMPQRIYQLQKIKQQQKLAKFFISFYLLLFALPAWSNQLIIEPDMGRQPILNTINQAQHSIALVMYGFTDKELLNAILEKKNQGKTVKVILESSPYKTESENNKAIAAFNTYDLAWQGHISPFRFIHQKTLIVDNSKAIVMTFNFTNASFKNERNFGLIIDDARQVRAINDLFSADWNHVAYLHSGSNLDFGDDLIISPDNSRDKLLSLINHAKTSIKIYAQNINDYKMIGALANAARRNIKVEIISSSHLIKKQNNYLKRAGVIIYYTKKLMIHAKVFIIDNTQAVIGSINLTRASLDDNRELSVITRDAEIIKQLNNTFNNDMNDSIKPHSISYHSHSYQSHSYQSNLSSRVKRKISKFFTSLSSQLTR
jgi:cardiolipin synthase